MLFFDDIHIGEKGMMLQVLVSWENLKDILIARDQNVYIGLDVRKKDSNIVCEMGNGFMVKRKFAKNITPN